MRKTGAQTQREYKARLRADPVAWEEHLRRCRKRDAERRPRTQPKPEDFDWSVIWSQKRRSDMVSQLVFTECWKTILFMVPALWRFRIDCATLNRKHALKMKARWINRRNPQHIAGRDAYNMRPDIVERRRQSRQRIKQETEHIRKTPEHRASVAKYERELTHRSPQRKISKRLRTRVYQAIKMGLGVKSQSTVTLIGCSIPELMRHLESQFLPGMTWENYGVFGWHVDHKVPCAAFDLTDEEQQRKCFNFSNLCPLWATDNWSKSSKVANGLKAIRKPATV